MYRVAVYCRLVTCCKWEEASSTVRIDVTFQHPLISANCFQPVKVYALVFQTKDDDKQVHSLASPCLTSHCLAAVLPQDHLFTQWHQHTWRVDSAAPFCGLDSLVYNWRGLGERSPRCTCASRRVFEWRRDVDQASSREQPLRSPPIHSRGDARRFRSRLFSGQ